MAIGASALDSIGDFSAGLTITTNSVSPSSNALVLISIYARNQASAADPGTPTVVGNGITYTLIDSQLFDSSRRRHYLFRGLAASPSAGTIVCTWGVNVIGQVHVVQFTGVDTSGVNGAGAVVQSAKNSATNTTLSVTLASFGDATNNASFGAFMHATNEVTTHEGGYTELTDLGGTASGMQTEWKTGEDTGVSASWATSSLCSGIAAEIKMASASTVVQDLIGGGWIPGPR